MMIKPINDRIDLRINKEQKELIQYASHLQGYKGVSEFVVSYISKAAREIVKENNQILKSYTDQKIFIDALVNPPKPNPQFKKANIAIRNL